MPRRTTTKARGVPPLMLAGEKDADPSLLPVSAENLRLELLRTAGVDADLLKATVDQLKAALNAKDVKLVTHEGRVTAQVEVPNWDAVLRASDQLFKLLGVYAPKRTEGADPRPQRIVVAEPEWVRKSRARRTTDASGSAAP